MRDLCSLAPHAARKPEILAALNAHAPTYGLTTPERLAMFLAQIAHESLGLTRWEESFSYTAERLVLIFPRHFHALAEAGAVIARGRERLAGRVLFHLDAWRAERAAEETDSLRRKIKREEDALALLVVISVGLLVAGLLLISLGARAATPTLGTYMLTVGELRAALSDVDDSQPLAVAVGKYKAAPIRADLRTMSVDAGRAGWWDKHLEAEGNVVVLVLDESARTEATRRSPSP